MLNEIDVAQKRDINNSVLATATAAGVPPDGQVHLHNSTEDTNESPYTLTQSPALMISSDNESVDKKCSEEKLRIASQWTKHNPRSTAKKTHRHFVRHNYHDYANETAFNSVAMTNAKGTKFNHISNSLDEKRQRQGPRGGVTTPFPVKLHQMMEKAIEDGYACIISWQPHGRCFIIHKPKEFAKGIMPSYFRQSKLTSFQRQLNLYGFSRLTTGSDKGGYYHELFLRGKPSLSYKMMRTRIKGTGIKAASSPLTEPNFYTMPLIHPENSTVVEAQPMIALPDFVSTSNKSFDYAPIMVSASSNSLSESVNEPSFQDHYVQIPPSPTAAAQIVPLESSILVASSLTHPTRPQDCPFYPVGYFSPTSLVSSISDIVPEDEMDCHGCTIMFEGRPFHYLDWCPKSFEEDGLSYSSLLPPAEVIDSLEFNLTNEESFHHSQFIKRSKQEHEESKRFSLTE